MRLSATLIRAGGIVCSAAVLATAAYSQTRAPAKDHGGKDCGDDDTDNTSMGVVTYLLFEPKLTEFIICTEAAVQSCFGPLRRLVR